jgi:hypothetical protein
MKELKGSSEVIFYLKLRHNSLPKLQDFVFLGLDIRHLTIHNSSLVVVEESSLSSLGGYRRQLRQDCLRLEALRATTVNSTIFWNVMSCSLHKFSNVSEEHRNSIFMVERHSASTVFTGLPEYGNSTSL